MAGGAGLPPVCPAAEQQGVQAPPARPGACCIVTQHQTQAVLPKTRRGCLQACRSGYPSTQACTPCMHLRHLLLGWQHPMPAALTSLRESPWSAAAPACCATCHHTWQHLLALRLMAPAAAQQCSAHITACMPLLLCKAAVHHHLAQCSICGPGCPPHWPTSAAHACCTLTASPSACPQPSLRSWHALAAQWRVCSR
jgi:hypothetical protein